MKTSQIKHPALPHPPSEPLLTDEQIEQLDAFEQEYSEELAKIDKVKKTLAEWDEKVLTAEEREACCLRGEVWDNGKMLEDVSEDLLAVALGKSRSALILVRGRAAQAKANKGHLYDRIAELKREFQETWEKIILELEDRERKAWTDFYHEHLNRKSLLCIPHEIYETMTQTVVWEHLQNLRHLIKNSDVLEVIPKLKMAAKS